MNMNQIIGEDMFLSKGKFGIKFVPLGKIPGDIMEYLVESIQSTFRKKTYLVESLDIPVFAFDLKRSQYNVTELVNYLNARKKYKEKTVGIINEDIFIKDEPFIYGYSKKSKEIVVISLWRFRQNKDYTDFSLALDKLRVKKEVIKQLGLIYGLKYCKDPECVMYNSGTPEEMDMKSDRLCPSCRNNL